MRTYEELVGNARKARLEVRRYIDGHSEIWRGNAPIVFLTLQDAEEDELRAELSLTDFELSIILTEIDVLADFCRAASARRVARGKDPTWSADDEAFIQSMRTRQALWIVNATSMIFSFSTKD
jgi:hypothetical protein